jgi:hypothetical protein
MASAFFVPNSIRFSKFQGKCGRHGIVVSRAQTTKNLTPKCHLKQESKPPVPLFTRMKSATFHTANFATRIRK